MRANRTPDEWTGWCIARNRIADELKEYYRHLITLSKKLDEELLKKQNH
jgi:hypothetical protein